MDLREKTFKTLQSSFGECGAKGTLPFTCSPERPYDPSQMEEERNLNMILVYSADTVNIFEISNTGSPTLVDVSLDLRCKYKVHSTILSVTYFTTTEDKKTLFLVMFDDLKAATISFNYGLSAIETVCLHRLSTRETSTLLSSSSYKATKPMLRVDINGRGFAVLRDSCLLSLHLQKKTGRQLGIDGRSSLSGSVLIQKDFMEASEFYSHSLCLDFRSLSIQHVTDFAFICHPSLITVFAITNLPLASESQLRGYNDRLLEIKLSPALIQKLQTNQGRDEAKDRLAIKENISAVNFLPPELLKLFLLSNSGLVVATPDGIFYINQAWVYLITFDPQTTSTYLAGFPNIQIRECDLMLPNSRKELREAKYSLRHDVLAIEFSSTVVLVKFTFHQYHTPRIHSLAVCTLLKESLHDFSMLSNKNSLGTCYSSHELCIFKHDGSPNLDKNLPVESGDIVRFSKFQPLIIKITGVHRLRYNLKNLTDLTTFSQKSKNWDYAISFAGTDQDYFALIQEGIKYNSRDKFQMDRQSRLFLYDDYTKQENSIEASTIVMVNNNNQPSFLKVTSADRLAEVPLHEVSIPLIFDAHERIKSVHTIRSSRISCQVNTSSILFRSDASDLKVPLKADCIKAELYKQFLFILDRSLSLKVYYVYKEEGKIKCAQEEKMFLGESDFFSKRLTGFWVAGDMLSVAAIDGTVHLFSLMIAENTIVLGRQFVSNFIYGSALLKNMMLAKTQAFPAVKLPLAGPSQLLNELEQHSSKDQKTQLADQYIHSDPWRSATDPSWKLSFPLVFAYNLYFSNIWHIVLDKVIYLVLQLNSSEIFVYRSTSLEKELMKFKRVASDWYMNSKLTQDHSKSEHYEVTEDVVSSSLAESQLQLILSSISERQVILSGTNLKTAVITFCKGEVFYVPIKGVIDDLALKLTDGSILFKDSEGKLTFRRLFEPPNYCIEHRFPFVSYTISEKIIKLVSVEKEGVCGLVLLCKKFLSDEYRLLLFDINFCQYTDEVKFSIGDKVNNIKKLSLDSRNLEPEDNICVMYVQQGQGMVTGMYSKWRLIKFLTRAHGETGKKILKFDVREEYTEQETNELITTAFHIGETLFLAIDKRIVQMKNSGGYKVERTYYPNTSYIVDACVSNNSVIITNVKGNIIFMIWMKDQNKLTQKTEVMLCNSSFLMDSRFLDSKQAKFVCSDSENSIHIVKVYTDLLTDGREDITLKLNKLQRIKMPGRVIAMDSLKSSSGLILATSNGCIFSLNPILVRQTADSLHSLYKLMQTELPFPAGLNPMNLCYFQIGKEIQKMERKEFYNVDLLNSFNYLSLPWQSKLAASLETTRTDLATLILESLTEVSSLHN